MTNKDDVNLLTSILTTKKYFKLGSLYLLRYLFIVSNNLDKLETLPQQATLQ